jgi:hypothetical protein
LPGTPYGPVVLPPSKAAELEAGPLPKAKSDLVTLLRRLTIDVERHVSGSSRGDMRPRDIVAGEMPRYHLHFMAKTLMEDHEGVPLTDAKDALRHAKTMAAHFSESGILFGCTILVAKDDEVLFEVPLSRGMN